MLPHVIDVACQEREKYAEVWRFPEYREHSPGLINVDRFMTLMQPAAGSSLIDLGCGEGKAGIEFVKRGLHVWWSDITGTALDQAVSVDRFIESPLWSLPSLGSLWGPHERWDYGFCCDVMEHIPIEYTMLCIDRMLERCTQVYLSIALRPDVFGPRLIGEHLHLTVRDFNWWKVRLGTLGLVYEARDLLADGLYVVGRGYRA